MFTVWVFLYWHFSYPIWLFCVLPLNLYRYGVTELSGHWLKLWLAAYSPSWWRHQMETFSALLALCEGWIPSQRPVTRSFYVFFDSGLNNRLSKQSRRLWFETPSRSLWRQCNGQILPGQWWLIANWNLGNNFPCNMKLNTMIVSQENAVLKMPSEECPPFLQALMCELTHMGHNVRCIIMPLILVL